MSEIELERASQLRASVLPMLRGMLQSMLAGIAERDNTLHHGDCFYLLGVLHTAERLPGTMSETERFSVRAITCAPRADVPNAIRRALEVLS